MHYYTKSIQKIQDLKLHAIKSTVRRNNENIRLYIRYLPNSFSCEITLSYFRPKLGPDASEKKY